MNAGDKAPGERKQGKQIIYVRPYFTKELCTLYNNIDRKTFNAWIRPFRKELGRRIGYYWSIHQVRIIFERLELPSHIVVVDEFE